MAVKIKTKHGLIDVTNLIIVFTMIKYIRITQFENGGK